MRLRLRGLSRVLRRALHRIRRNCSVAFEADSVQFADGTRFPRDTLLTTSVDQPYRLDVLCFLAQFSSRYPGVVNAAAYLKARVFASASPRAHALTRPFHVPIARAGSSKRRCGDSRHH